MSANDPAFLAFTERYHGGANGLHTKTPLGFYADGWKDGQAARRPALREQLDAAIGAIGLLMNTVALMNSMIRSGESHSRTSETVMQESLTAARSVIAAAAEQPAMPAREASGE